MASSKKAHRRIGLITLRLENGLSASLWHGVLDEARKRKLTLVTFPGSPLSHPHVMEPETALNEVYHLAKYGNVDGLIIWTSGIGNYTEKSTIEHFCKSFKGIPTVVVGDGHAGLPRVDLDGDKGFRKLVKHLVVDHGFSRIAFLQGPESHEGARRRLAIYKEILESHRIPVRKELISPSSPDWWDCPRNVNYFFDIQGLVPGKSIQAIMAASDFIAGRCIHLLEARGIRVPEDIAVTGFDGEHIRLPQVPIGITTSTVSLDTQGARAVRLISEMLESKPIPPLSLVPGATCLLESCGCIPDPALRVSPAQAIQPARFHKTPSQTEPSRSSSPDSPGGLAGKLETLGGLEPGEGLALASRLMEVFPRAMADGNPEHLLHLIPMIRRTFSSRPRRMPIPWQEVADFLKEEFDRDFANLEDLRRGTDIIDKFRRQLSLSAASERELSIGSKETQLTFIRSSQEWFVTSAQEKTLPFLLPYQFDSMGLKDCAIMLYQGGYSHDSGVRVFLNYHHGQVIEENSHRILPPGSIFPPSWKTGSGESYVVMSLYFQSRSFGFIVFRALPGLPDFIFSSIATMVNTPLWSMVLLKERDEREKELYHAKESAERERRKAEEATQAKSAFLATMSHELRTPLTAILGLSSLLMDSSLDTRQSHYVQTIKSSGDVLLGLISDILDFSKIEAGKLDLEITEFELSQITESCMDLFSLRCSQKGIDQFLYLDKALKPNYWGDTTRIRQVLVNLLNNAVKFTDSGRIILEAEIWDPSNMEEELPAVNMANESRNLTDLHSDYPYHDHTLVHFCVKDTGIGIKQENQARLFQSFSQGDPSTTRKYGGSGLGLTISQRLVGLMGGKLWFRSTGVQGEGSEFHFILPFRNCSTNRSLPEEDRQLLEGKRILLIHQDSHMVQHLKNCLQDLPVTTGTIHSPRMALRHLMRSKQEGPAADLLILDYQMRDFSGHEFLNTLRRQTRYRTVPVVLLVQISELPSRNSRKALAYCTKPVQRSVLSDTIQELLRNPDSVINRKPTGVKNFDHDLAKNCPLRILLAEDNQVNQMLIQALLERFGFGCDWAKDGKEAINKASRKIYDLVLMDVQMPEIDGIEAARFLNDHLRPSWRPRIVAITANVLQDDKQRCFEAGMQDYISKPIQTADLERVIRDTWDALPHARKRQRGSPAQAGAARQTKPRSTHQLLLSGLDPHLIDIATLGNLFELLGNQATVREMVHGYLNQARDYLATLDHALAESDLKLGHRCAHSLKSGSYTLGARNLGDMCKSMEDHFKSGHHWLVRPLHARAKDEFGAVEAAFTAMLERMDMNN